MNLFTNNAKTVLDVDILASDTTISVFDSNAFAFPTAPDVQVVTITDVARTVYEVLYITENQSGFIVCTRGEEGTVALDWVTGSIMFAGVTAGVLDTINSDIVTAMDAATTAATDAATAIGLTAVLGLEVVVDTTKGTALANGVGYVPRTVGDPTFNAPITSFGSEVVIRFPRVDLGIPADLEATAGATYAVGDIRKDATGNHYRVISPNGFAGATSDFIDGPTPNTNVAFAPFTTFDATANPASTLMWWGYDPTGDITAVLDNALLYGAYFYPTEVGLLVKTDGTLVDSATISFGKEAVPDSVLVDQVVDVDATSDTFNFRFPITAASAVIKDMLPVFKTVTFGTVGSMKATPYIKGFFIQVDEVV